MNVEPLEPRIAPAAITILGKTATWTDFDGDIVTMKWSSADAPAFTTMDKGAGLLVSRILLDGAKHNGASFTVTVKAAGDSGDGRVELGHLDGVGVVLKSWVGAKAAISELDLGIANIASVGTFISGGIGQTKSSFFTGSMGDGASVIKGYSGTVKINGDIGYGGISFQGGAGGNHGTITIAGSLRGDLPGGGNSDGAVGVFGGGQALTIRGSILNSYLSQSTGSFKSVTVGGDVVSNVGFIPQALNVATQKLTISGSLIGANVQVVGATAAPLKSVFVGGSIVAKDGIQGSGVLEVVSQVPVKSVTIKGSLFGAEFSSWLGEPYGAGAVDVFGSVGVITIGGSIHGGKIASSDPAVNGGIHVTENVGALNIGGSIYGYENDPVFILVGGRSPAAGDFSAIGKLGIKGSAIHAYIAAGTRLSLGGGGSSNSPLELLTGNPDAGIGSVSIGGNFVNSNIYAGVDDGGALGVNSADTLATGDPARTAKLGPVAIKGYVLHDRGSAMFSGFSADVIASITVAGRKVFTAGDNLLSFDDFTTAKEL